MASAPESVRRFEEADIFVASPALTARRLRETTSLIDVLWLASEKGGGENAPQVEPAHLTNFILAQGAHLPIDAAAAVGALRELPVTATETFLQTAPTGTAAPFQGATVDLSSMSGQTLGEVLDDWINVAADPVQRGVMASVMGYEWALTLCTNPAFATISQRVGSTIETVTFGRRVFTEHAQRLIALPFKVITLAGELWQDTCEKRGKIFPVPASRNENADVLPGAPASRVPPTRPRASDRSASLNSPGSNRSRARRQSRTSTQ